MLLQRLISFAVLLAFLVTGGLTGRARVDLCIDKSGSVSIETPFDRCCEPGCEDGDRDRPADPAPADATFSSDCVTCSDIPLGTGEAKPAPTRDLKNDVEPPHPLPILIAAILLPPPPQASVPIAVFLHFPASEPTHESVAVTVIRC